MVGHAHFLVLTHVELALHDDRDSARRVVLTCVLLVDHVLQLGLVRALAQDRLLLAHLLRGRQCGVHVLSGRSLDSPDDKAPRVVEVGGANRLRYHVGHFALSRACVCTYGSLFLSST